MIYPSDFYEEAEEYNDMVEFYWHKFGGFL
jgi:hypothetical protein